MGPLASAIDLARFHTARATLYHAIAFLIGAPPNERTRRVARGILAGSTITSPAREALELAIDAGPACGEDPVRCDACEHKHQVVRSDAFHAVDQLELDTPGAEADVLGALAERSARAIRQHDLREAAKLAELQYRFIDQHAAECLGKLAADLQDCDSERARHLGRAIDLLLESDLRMLDVAPIGPRYLPVSVATKR